jgi:hemerythrin HHE cation binding domain-containing protein
MIEPRNRVVQVSRFGDPEGLEVVDAPLPTSPPPIEEAVMKFGVPEPMKIEHEELHSELVRATKAGGKTGEAARAVAKVLHPHFIKEEEYALPPLGLLVRLSKGEFGRDMSEVLAMTDKLEAELPRMLAEHREIITALQKLIAASQAEGKPEVAGFAEKLMLHAQTEEQVAYPTSLLIGRYVKLQLAATTRVPKAQSAA